MEALYEIKARFQMISYKLRKVFKKKTRKNSQESESILCSQEDITDQTRKNVHKALALSMGERPESFNFAHKLIKKQSSTTYSTGSTSASLMKRQSSTNSNNSFYHARVNQQWSSSSGGSASHGRLGSRFSKSSSKKSFV